MICAVWSGAEPLVGQATAPYFDRYGVEDGLSNSGALSLAQDNRGFLWIGTQGGLNRFDGHGFLTFTPRQGDPTSLSSGYVHSLLVALDGTLWVGTERGLNRFRADGTFERFSISSSTQTDEIRSIAQAPSGELVLGTLGGAFIFDPRTGVASEAPGNPRDEDGASVAAAAVATLPDGRLVIGGDGGSVRVLERRGAGGSSLWGETSRVAVGADVRALLAIEGDSLLIGTEAGQVYLVTSMESPVVVDSLFESATDSLGAVQDIYRSHHGVTWVATQAGLIELQPDGERFRHRPDPIDPASLPDLDVLSVLEDRVGVLWIASWGGLASLGTHRHAIRRYASEDMGRGVLSPGGVVGIEEDDRGALWLGQMNGALDAVDPRDGNVRVYRPDGSPIGSPGPHVFGVEVDRSGFVWSATVGGGISRLDPRSGERRQYFPLGEDGVRLDAFASIHEDHEGELWAGSMSGGLLRYDRRLARFTSFRGPDGRWDYGEPYIWPIVTDSLGQLWFAANGADGGIHRISADRTELWSLMFDATTPDGLSEGRILTLYPDLSGRVWVGTEGGGLNRIDPATRDVVVYRVADGLPHDNVAAITSDLDGHIWVGTNGGLVRFDPEAEQFWGFTRRDGLQADRFHANAAYRDAEGRLYFGGPGGLNVIDPARLVRRETPPPIVITRFRIKNEDQPIGPWAEGETPLVIPPGENFFTFDFSALDFTDPSLNRYRYKLEGLQEEWFEGPGERSANYTSVPPDRYRFLVSAANSEGVWNDEGLSIEVDVQPWLFQRAWFQALVVAAIAGLVTAGYNYRVRQQLRLERLRLNIAGELHDDIGANLSTISLRAQMAERTGELGEAARRQLDQVSELARNTAESLRELVWVVNTDYDTLAHLVTRMEDTASIMLEDAIPYSFEVAGPIPPVDLKMELRRSIYLMFREALQNVEKHAEASHVAIEVAYERGNLSLRIADDGKGFDPETVRRGNGTRLMRQRAKRLKASVIYDSRPGEGTTLRLVVPVG